jgi:hypothetical protein
MIYVKPKCEINIFIHFLKNIHKKIFLINRYHDKTHISEYYDNTINKIKNYCKSQKLWIFIPENYGNRWIVCSKWYSRLIC